MKELRAIIQGFYKKANFVSRLVTVVAAVILMGFAMSLLMKVNLGTDPCTLMNNSIAMTLGMTLGNWQALLNIILLIFVVLFGGRNLGFGTIANMFLVGYSIDFFNWVWNHILPSDAFDSWTVRIVILVPALLLFILAAAVYMEVDMGTAPYDAVPYIISTKFKKIPFRIIRMAYDFLVILVGLVFGGKIQIVTVLMALLLGPVISWVGTKLKRLKGLEEEEKL